METKQSIILPSIILTALLFLSAQAKGQHLQDTLAGKGESSHSVFLSAGYGENLVVGSSISRPQSFCYGSLTYSLKNELFLSASSFYLPDYAQFPAYNNLSANYSHSFNSWFDISAGISGFKSHSELKDTLFSSFLYGEISVGFDWRIAYTKLSFAGILSGAAGKFMQVRNSRYFQTADLFSGKLNISFDPYISLLLGSLTKIVTVDGTSTGVSSPLWTGGGYSGGSGTGSGSGPGNGGGGSAPAPSMVTSVFFGLMEVDFGLPVSINAGKVTFELEPGYVVPMFTDPSIPNPEGFSMMLNCYVKIF